MCQPLSFNVQTEEGGLQSSLQVHALLEGARVIFNKFFVIRDIEHVTKDTALVLLTRLDFTL